MRHLAWLHETPEGSKKSRFEAFNEKDENSPQLEMPETDGADYLIGLIGECGPSRNFGMGPFPLCWSEIEAWERCAERELTCWERVTLKEMSEAYVAMRHQATKKDCEPPYKVVREDVEQEREVTANKLKNALKGFSRNK